MLELSASAALSLVPWRPLPGRELLAEALAASVAEPACWPLPLVGRLLPAFLHWGHRAPSLCRVCPAWALPSPPRPEQPRRLVAAAKQLLLALLHWRPLLSCRGEPEPGQLVYVAAASSSNMCG